MSNKIIFKAGEATIYTEGKDVTAAMPEILIGAVDGPVGQAFANLMAQSKGHTAMFAVRDINQMVRPVTMTVPKVTLKDSTNVELFGGVVQAATADAVLDCRRNPALGQDGIRHRRHDHREHADDFHDAENDELRLRT